VGARRPVAPKPRKRPPTSAEMINETIELDGVAVIAYICKRIHRSPDPDPSLTWSD
jgi:hypothetical protein